MALEEYSPKDPNVRGRMSLPNFRDIAARARLIEDAGAYGGGAAVLRGEGEVETVIVWIASDGIFRALGVAPMLGRTFTREESSPEGRDLERGSLDEPLRLWSRIAGRTILMESGSRAVIGVMPARFNFPEFAKLWLPLQEDPGATPRTIPNWKRIRIASALVLTQLPESQLFEVSPPIR